MFGNDLNEIEYAVEVSYEGTYELDEAVLKDGSKLDDHFERDGRLDRIHARPPW